MARRKHREGAEPAEGARRPGAVQHRVRQRRLVDLLRAGPRGAVGPRRHAGRLPPHRPALLHHRLVVRRGDGHGAGGRRLVQLRPPRLQRVRQLRRRLGADARLHRHRRHQRLLRAQLPGRLLAGAQDLPVQLHRRHRHHHRAGGHQRRRHQGGRAPQHRPRAAGPRHAGPAHGPRRGAAAAAQAADRPGPPRRGADVGAPHLRHLHRHHRLHGHRDRLQHVGGGGEPGQGRAAGHQPRARRRPRRLSRHLDDGALGDAGEAQRAARSTRRPGRRCRSRSSPRARTSPPGRSCSRARRRRATRTATCSSRRRSRRTSVGHPGAEAGAGDLHPGRPGVHQALRHAARQRLQGRPGRGHRALPAGRPRLAQDDPHALGRHPGRDHPAHRHQRRPHRRVAAGLLPGAAPAGAAHPRPRPPEATDAVRGHHRLRGVACVPAPLTGQHHQPPRRPVRLRRHDLVHRGSRLRRLAAPQGAGLPAAVPHADQHPGRQDVGAGARGHRRARHLHGVVRRRRHASRSAGPSASSGWASACSCTWSTARPRATR